VPVSAQPQRSNWSQQGARPTLLSRPMSVCHTHERHVCFLFVNRPVRTRMPGGVGSCALKAHGIQSPEMATAAKLSQQPRTESCVMPGNGHCEA